MGQKQALLVINPRAGQNLTQLSDILVVLEAAGWKTDVALKEYGGHTMQLATKGARKDFDVIIAYGGDGTLNQVINGVMKAKTHKCVVGLIPGGTANVWATEVNIPVSPVKAALTLIDSQPRPVDIGHFTIESLSLPGTDSTSESQTANTANTANQPHILKVKSKAKARRHFLLMAGLGIDAAIMGHVSKPLKYKLGPIAVGVSAASELPTQGPFPIEIRAQGDGRQDDILWQGEALQVVIGNTRRYADVVEMTPNAYIDDGILDICVITAGNPLTTMQQLSSLLLRRKPDNLTAEYFHGSHLSISVPATIHLQLDGSAVKLDDYLSKSDRQALQHVPHLEHVMVNYRFDAIPHALPLAIPNNYNDALFEHPSDHETPQTDLVEQTTHETSQQRLAEQTTPEQAPSPQSDQPPATQQQALQAIEGLLNHGRTIKVVGSARHHTKKPAYIIAGTTQKPATGEAKPIAIRIDSNTTIRERTGESVHLEAVLALQEGATIIVVGQKNRRGVISAEQIVL